MPTSELQSLSILCLEDAQMRLYVELIQMLTHSPTSAPSPSSEPMAWLRPFAIQVNEGAIAEDLEVYGDRHPDGESLVFDARNTSDLIWPIHLFRPGLDTEVVNLLTILPMSSGIVMVSPDKHRAARRILNQFLHRIWRDNKAAFPLSDKQPFH
jgi:hypothetical protein